MKPGEIVFIAGNARSGTTWLANLVNYRGDYTYYFEPFHKNECPVFTEYSWRQYLYPENRDARYLEPMRFLLEEEIDCPWVTQFSRAHDRKRLLIKAIRANLFLKWLRTRFPMVRIVFIIRHPLAVAASKVRTKWVHNLDNYTRQKDLVTNYLEPHLDLIKEAREPFLKHVIMWCIETLIPLHQFKKDDGIHVLFYEHLYENPHREIDRLFYYLRKGYTEGVFKELHRPSEMATSSSAVSHGKNPVRSWQSQVSPAAVEVALGIVRQFGLDHLYDSDPFPRISLQENYDSLFLPFKESSH